MRCGRIHEDEKKVSQPRERFNDSYRGSGAPSYAKKKVFAKRRINHTHVEQGVDEDDDPEDLEAIEEELLDETMEPEGSAEELGSSAEEVDEEELKEVFAAGWKAKQKTAEFRKNRGWKKPEGKRWLERSGAVNRCPQTSHYMFELWQSGALEGRQGASERPIRTGSSTLEKVQW